MRQNVVAWIRGLLQKTQHLAYGVMKVLRLLLHQVGVGDDNHKEMSVKQRMVAGQSLF